MRKRLHAIPVTLCFILLPYVVSSQLCTECDIDCIMCEDIDGFSGNNGSSVAGTGPASFCTFIQHQMLWLGFVAATENLSIEVFVESCTGGSLEVALYDAPDCNNQTLISNCFGGMTSPIPPGSSEVVIADQDLIPGQYYFLVFDMTSNIPANCDFTLSVVDGETGAPDLSEEPELDAPETLCDGETFLFEPETSESVSSYIWTLNGQDMGENTEFEFEETEQGTYTVCATPINYCSTGPQSCTDITVGISYEEYYFIEACYEDCAEFEGEIYCNDGERDFEYETEYGCDSIIILEIEWLNSDDEFYLGSIEICDSDSYEYKDEEYEDEGTYYVMLEDDNGCDSLVEFDLIVLDTIYTFLEATICEGSFYTFGEDSLFQAGVYTATEISSLGCDSIVELQLSIAANYYQAITDSFCANSEYVFADSTIQLPGTYLFEFQSEYNCDSIIELNLNPLDTIFVNYYDTICPGDSYSFADSLFSSAGTYTASYLTASQCDSIETLYLETAISHDFIIYDTICDGETYLVDSLSFNQQGSFEVHLRNEFGCDSLLQINLNVMPDSDTLITRELCPEDTLWILNQNFASEGNYSILTQASNSCDSTINIVIEEIPEFSDTTYISICQEEVFEWNGEMLGANGIYASTQSASNGCDSTNYLVLEILENKDSLVSAEICEGEIFNLGNQAYMEAGNYQQNLIASNGCDSILSLDLKILENPVTELVADICEGESLVFNGEEISQSGNYSAILTADSNCDSTVFLQVNVSEIKETFLEETLCEFESYEFHDSLIVDPGTYLEILETSAGCDSLIYLDIVFEDCSVQFTAELNDPSCNDSENGSIRLEFLNAYYPVHINLREQNSGFEKEIIIDSGTLTLNLENLPEGIYELQVMDGLGEITSNLYELTAPEILQLQATLSDYNSYNISCNEASDGSIDLLLTGGTPPYTSSWSDGSGDSSRSDLLSGSYTLTLTDSQGCQLDSTFILIEPEPIILSYELLTDNPCKDGFYSIFPSADGGSGILTFELEENMGFDQAFTDLEPGSYELKVFDSNNCEKIEVIEVPEIQNFTLDLGSDIEIDFGESIQLIPEVNFEVDAYFWTSIPDLNLCTDCEILELNPEENIEIILELVNTDGCIAKDSILITVKPPLRYYIPNIFSPGNSTGNKNFTIFFNRPRALENFEIFTRWGELVFSAKNIDSNTPESGWDGYYNNALAEQGVYIYRIRFEDDNGEFQNMIGSISLVR